MNLLKIQVVRKQEAKGLEYVQKHVNLGWKVVSSHRLGNEVYFVNLVWEKDGEPIYP